MQSFLQHEDINNGKKNFYEPDMSSLWQHLLRRTFQPGATSMKVYVIL